LAYHTCEFSQLNSRTAIYNLLTTIIKEKYMAEPTTYSNAPMAERRTNPWAWIVPLLIIAAAIAAYAYYQNRDQTNTNTQTSGTSTQTQTETHPINNATDLGTAAAGTTANLSNIAINQVVSDRLFTIKAGSQTIYSILSPNVTLPNQTTLKSGQQVAMTGTLVSTNSDMFNSLNLTAAEKSALTKQSLVLLVDQVTISGSNATTNPSSATQ
jgi:hypothetical protein